MKIRRRMTKRITVLFLALTVFVYTAKTQVTDPSFDPALAQTLQALTDNAGKSYKGLSVAVDIPGQGRWIGSYGVSKGGAAIKPDMRFCIASCSKTFVAGLCLKLQDEGLLHLDDSIGTYLPYMKHVNPGITVRQLLSHQSGLFDFYNDASYRTLKTYNNNPDSLWTSKAVLATIGAPHFQPGQGYRYSNTNFLVAALVCEAAGGDSFRNLLHQYIIEPLGLSKTAYPAGGDQIFDAPWAKLFDSSSPRPSPERDEAFSSFIQAAGGIWSTADDLATWFRQLFGNDFLSPYAQEQLRQVTRFNYSLGMRANIAEGGIRHYHSGAWGYRSIVLYDANSGIVVSVLSNLRGKSVNGLAIQLLEAAVNMMPRKAVEIAAIEVKKPIAVNSQTAMYYAQQPAQLGQAQPSYLTDKTSQARPMYTPR